MPPRHYAFGDVPQFRTPNYNSSRGGHLMPPGPHDTFTMLSQSPMSPASSFGPDHAPDSTTFLEVPPRQTEDMSQSLMGISPRLALETNFGDFEFSFDDALAPDDPPGPLFPPQPDASSPLLERLHSELEQIGATVQEIASYPGVPQLYDAKELLKCRFSSFETTIQTRIERDERPSLSSRFGDRFLCRLCQYGHRKVYKSRGTFKRHVSEGHHPRYQFRCPSSCGWTSFRRDKVHDHFRNTHRHAGRLRRDQINRIERRIPPPMICEICSRLVDGWDDYFKCVSEHCRLREDDSTNTSASQSRRSSGDSGSGANGGSGNFNGGGFLGPQNPFQFGGGGGQMNGGSYYSNTDQHYFSQASSYSEFDSASLSRQSLPGVLGSRSESPVSFRRQTFHHSFFKQPSRMEAILREPEISPGHRQPLRRSSTESSLSSTDADSDLLSPPKIPPPKPQSADSPVRGNPLANLFKNDLPRSGTLESDVRDNKECKNCGHIMGDCTSCHSLQLSVNECHICVKKSCQKVSEETSQLPKFSLHEVTVGQEADGTKSEDSTSQVSDISLHNALRIPADDRSELTEKHSSRIMDDVVNTTDTPSAVTMGPNSATVPMGSRKYNKTDPLNTSALTSLHNSLSVMLVPKDLPSSTHDALSSESPTQQKAPSKTKSLVNSALSAPLSPSNPHYGLGLYGYHRPKLNLDQSSLIQKMIPQLMPPKRSLKHHTGKFLSTELTPSIRHGRAKLSRSRGSSHPSQNGLQLFRTPTPIIEEVEPQEENQDEDIESLDLVAQSSFALSQRLERPDDPLRSNRSVPSKHILSRKKYNALRTKLQVLVEILALRRSSKAPILAPEEANTSYLKCIIPSGSYLKSPILDFDLSRLDIQSSLPLLLETMSLLETDPKGYTSQKLTDYIYDPHDEMHLLLITLIPLIKKLLWMPTLSVDSAMAAAVAIIEV
ncbi:putative C2H2 zinc finger domain protein [Aspergillus melleus]|uniref:putative C2H2 zinc finger domain protein n=1 Tax=Aspergillus melleus TaxID=138277 RepID=UPI001E8E80CF|nr:uncharacterized protein LDX57_004215 [Aspergillus melleus]KAH8426480.1 hypothetical protein LDX57_004215 [Aspergillus melleus]